MIELHKNTSRFAGADPENPERGGWAPFPLASYINTCYFF